MYLRRTTLGLITACLATAVVAVAAWAGFTGPNRTTTEEVRNPSKDVWTCRRGSSSCEFAAGHPQCGNHPSRNSQIRVCGWVASNCSCERAYKEKTTNLPPATVSGSFTCGTQGENGWCIDGASLELSAEEPLGGEVIQAIEGTPGGVLCDPEDSSEVSCSWNGGDQGDYVVEFWAVSSYGDTSEKQSSGWKLDTEPPDVDLDLDGGEKGDGGWYRDGTVSISASGSDSVSGVDTVEVSLDGGSWEESVQVDSDGVYEVEARVTDRAGHSASETTEIKYDGSPPSVEGSFSGTKGNDGWYTSSVTASASASDGLSGVAAEEVKIDGGSWQGSPAKISGDGTHHASFRASDKAGNQRAGDEMTIRIDGTEPHSEFVTPKEGSDSWISGEFTFSGESGDATSGLARVEISLNGGDSWQSLNRSGDDWSYTWDTRSVPNGTYQILARAQDVAGNRESTARVTVRVDNEPPLVDIPDSWTLGDHAPLSVTEQDIGLDRVEIAISAADQPIAQQDYDAGAVPDSVQWEGRGPDGQLVPAGEYLVTATAWDLAGNRGSDTGIVAIPAPPIEEPPPVEDTTPIELVIVDPVNPRAQPGSPQDLIGGVPGAEGASTLATSSIAQSPAQALDFRRIWIWPAFAWAGLLTALGYAKLTDPRPRTLRGLRSDLRRIRKLQE